MSAVSTILSFCTEKFLIGASEEFNLGLFDFNSYFPALLFVRPFSHLYSLRVSLLEPLLLIDNVQNHKTQTK